eukprot:492871-Amorphochlora_amoeboformis.AAC.1
MPTVPDSYSRNLVRMWLNRTPSEVIKKTAVRAVSGLKSETVRANSTSASLLHAYFSMCGDFYTWHV